MKTKFTSIVILLMIIGGGLYAQIPNGDFETWTDFGDWEDPEDWYTLNELYGGDPETVRSTGDAISGDAAVRMENKKDDNDNVVRAMLVSGNQSLTNNPGFPYSKQPSSLKGFFNYEPKDDDSCYVSVYLTRYNLSAESRETVGSGVFAWGDQTDDYAEFNVPINYVSASIPDTAYIVIYAGKFNGAQEGSRLLIDALSFEEETSTGITETAEQPGIVIYPNPVHDYLTLQSHAVFTGSILQILDLTGKFMKSMTIEKSEITIPVGDIPEGIYQYRIIKGSQLIHFGKFLVTN